MHAADASQIVAADRSGVGSVAAGIRRGLTLLRKSVSVANRLGLGNYTRSPEVEIGLQ